MRDEWEQATARGVRESVLRADWLPFEDAFYHRNNVYPKVTLMAIIVNKPPEER